MNEKLKVSLGCGREKKEGFIGLDIVDFGWNKVWNAKDQIPLSDNSIDFILMENFLEHVRREEWIKLFNECWRVLKPQGTLEIHSPDAERGLDSAMSDPTHLSMITRGLFKYLRGERPRNADYGIKKWITEVGDDPKDSRCFIATLKPDK